MIVTIIVAWVAAQSEHFNPWLLFLGTVWIDIAIVQMFISIFG